MSHWTPRVSPLAFTNFDDVKDMGAQAAFRALLAILLRDQSWSLLDAAEDCAVQLRVAADTFNKTINVPPAWKPK